MSDLRYRVGSLYAGVFGRPSLAPISQALFYLGARGLGMTNSTPGVSGEDRIARRYIPTEGHPVVFDVGANKGEWSQLVVDHAPGARVHAFEPNPALASSVQAQLPTVAVNACALGAVAGSAVLHTYADEQTSGHASLIRGVFEEIHKAPDILEMAITVDTLDQYCAAKDIARIDFLKIDVEGFELQVLKGASRLLNENRIGHIQFEFNEMNTISRTMMYDFREILPNHDLYRILPHGLFDLGKFRPWLREQFVFQNILAVPKAP